MSFFLISSTYFSFNAETSRRVPMERGGWFLSFSKDFVFGGFGSPPCRIRQAIAFVPRFQSGPVHQSEYLPPALQFAARIPLPQVLQGRLSRLCYAVGGEHLPQAKLVGGQLFIAVYAEGVAQNGAVLGT